MLIERVICHLICTVASWLFPTCFSALGWRERLGCSLNSLPLASVVLLLDSAFASSSQCPSAIRIPGWLVLSITCYRGDAINELGFEENICVVEHAVFKGNHDELRVSEMCSQHLADVLRVRQIKCGVYLVQDIQRSRFKKQH